MSTLMIFGWMLLSLACATVIMYIGEKKGVEYSIGLFTALVVMAQIFAGKLVAFGSFSVPAGVIVFSISFLVTDALTEFCDKKTAMKAVYSGFLASLLLVLGIWIVLRWDHPEFWTDQAAYETVLSSTWRIVLASLAAYIFSQSWDVYVYDRIRRATRGRHLWLRNTASTISSQLIDSFVFVTIAFAGIFAWPEVFALAIGQFMVKLIIACFDTPFLYWLRWARRGW